MLIATVPFLINVWLLWIKPGTRNISSAPNVANNLAKMDSTNGMANHTVNFFFHSFFGNWASTEANIFFYKKYFIHLFPTHLGRNDYFDMFAPKCAGCNRAIMENYISALNAQWHADCFVCRVCQFIFSLLFLSLIRKTKSHFYSIFLLLAKTEIRLIKFVRPFEVCFTFKNIC